MNTAKSLTSIKKYRSIHPTVVSSTLHPALQDKVKNMNLKDMQKKAIVLGMKPRHVVSSDYWTLLSYINDNWGNKEDEALLLKYDQWVDRKLLRLGLEPIAPSMRMSYTREEDISEEAVKERVEKKKARKETKKKSSPRIKTDYGVVEGTKKHFVYEQVKKGKADDKIIKSTIKKYPESKENSIKIWISKAKKCFKDQS